MKTDEKYSFGKDYDYTVKLKNGKNVSISDALERIKNYIDAEALLDQIDIMAKADLNVKVEKVFSVFVYSQIIGSRKIEDHRKEPSMLQVQKMIMDTYQANPDDFEAYNRAYYNILLGIIESPSVYFVKSTKETHHLTMHYTYKEAIDEIINGGYPHFKYAEKGFINIVRSSLSPENNTEDESKPIREGNMLSRGDAKRVATESLPGIMDYFLERFGFFNKPKYRKQCLMDIKELCEESQKYRDFFLDYYESHAEMFDKAFLEYPEYIFIVQGKYQRYEVVMELSEKLELTMQDFKHEEEFFTTTSPRITSSDSAAPKARKGDYAFGIKVHQVKLIKALDRFTQKLISNGIDYQIINFWPNQTLDKKITSPVGPYVAVAFKKDDKWYLLIDGVYERCAIYVWIGENLSDGLNIFKISKTYARDQKNVRHHNHRGLVEDYDITYSKVLAII